MISGPPLQFLPTSKVAAPRRKLVNITLADVLAFLLGVVIAASLSSCTVTETTAPDGTVTKTKTPAPGSLELAGKAIEVIGAK